jgi:ApeA N-terminal domain 1
LQPFEHAGRWWLPGREEQPVSGTLRFSHGESDLKLTLIGTLTEHAGRGAPLGGAYPVIFGMTQTGEEVTLCNCFRSGFRSVGVELPPRAQEEVIIVPDGFIGAHIPEGDQHLFHSLRLDLTHLAEWANVHGFAKTQREDNENLNITFHIPPPVKAQIPIGAVQVVYGLAQNDRSDEYIVRRPVSLIIDVSDPRQIREMYDWVIRPLQYLLTLACDAPVQLKAILLFSDALKDDIGGHLISREIKYVYSGWPADEEGKQYSFRMLFPLDQVQDQFQDLVERWFSLFERLRNSLDLLFAVILGPRVFLETRFLLIAQAVEVFHRRMFPGEVLPRKEHRERVTTILDSVDAGFREWMREKLAYSNEPTLLQRLNAICEYAGGNVDRLLNSEARKKVKDTRNYLTHYDPRSKSKAAEGEELLRLGERLIALLQVCLLRQLGFSEDRSWKLLKQTNRYKGLHVGDSA